MSRDETRSARASETTRQGPFDAQRSIPGAPAEAGEPTAPFAPHARLGGDGRRACAKGVGRDYGCAADGLRRAAEPGCVGAAGTTSGVALALGLCLLALLAAPLAGAEESIDPLSGALVLSADDLSTPAGALTLELRRWYVPGAGGDGVLGAGWRTNWDTRLVRQDDGYVLNEGALALAFTPTARAGELQGPAGDRLVVDAAGQAVRSTEEGEERFSADGRLAERRDRSGNPVVLRYDASRRLVAVEGPRGARLSLERDGAGRTTRVTTVEGRSVGYAYAASGRVSEVKAADGSWTRYDYDGAGRLARIEDSLLGTTSFRFDERGRVVAREGADGSRDGYAFDDERATVTVTDRFGARTVLRSRDNGRRLEIAGPEGGATTLEYDAGGRLVRAAGPTGLVTTLAYDPLGRLVSLTEPGARVTRIAYLGEGPLVAGVIGPDGAEQRLSYDPKGRLVAVSVGGERVASFGYDAEGQLTAVEEPGSKRTFATDERGRITAVTDGLGRATRYAYDERGNLVRETDPAGGRTTRAYDPQGRLITVVEPGERVTRLTWDARGRLVGVLGPSGEETRYTYDAAGRRWIDGGETLRLEDGQRLVVTRPDGAVETTVLGPSGEPVESTDVLGRVSRYAHDPSGRLTLERLPSGREIRYSYGPAGDLAAAEDTVLGRLALSHDRAGRLTRVTSATGSTSFRYDLLERVTGVTDPLGGETRLAYGPPGRLAEVVTPGGGRTAYAYDAEGQLVSVTAPGGGVDRYAHDALGNVVETSDAAGRRTRLAYNPAGELAAVTDPAGGTRRFATAPGERRTELPDGTRLVERFDDAGRLLQIDDGRFPVVWTYDGLGRVAAVGWPAVGETVRYAYDGAGRRTTLTASDGRAVGYRYDPLGRLAAVVLPDDAGEIGFAYDAADRMTEIRYPNGILGRLTYGPGGEVATLTYQDPAAKTLLGWRCEHDPAGNPLAVSRSDGVVRRYAYDADGRLTAEGDGRAQVTYRYDADGNRVARTAPDGLTEYAYGAGGTVQRAGGETFAHDAVGNLVRRAGAGGTTTYGYDGIGRLISATTPRGRIDLGYAATGDLVLRREAGRERRYLYDGPDLLEELDPPGKTTALYVHGPGVDQPLAVIRQGRTLFLHADTVGTVAAASDAEGRVVARQETDAFGRLAGPGGDPTLPFGFQGRPYDTALGLYHLRARWYDPGLGRFLTPDPAEPVVGDPATLNRYAFARNAPTRYGDPTGAADLDLAYYQRFGVGGDEVRRILSQRVDQLMNPPAGTVPLGRDAAMRTAIRQLDAAVTRARMLPSPTPGRVVRSVNWQVLQAPQAPNPLDYNRLLPPRPPPTGASPLTGGRSSFAAPPGLGQRIRDGFGGLLGGGPSPPPGGGAGAAGRTDTQAIRPGGVPGSGTQAIQPGGAPGGATRGAPGARVRPMGFTRPPGVDNFGGGYSLVDGKPGPVRVDVNGVNSRYGPPSAASSASSAQRGAWISTWGGLIGMSVAAGAVNTALCARGGGSARECGQTFVATTATGILAGATVRAAAAVVGGAIATTVASAATVAALAYQGGKAAGQRIFGTAEDRRAQAQIGDRALGQGDELVASLTERQRTLADSGRTLRADLQKARGLSSRLTALTTGSDPRSACGELETLVEHLRSGAGPAAAAAREARQKLEAAREPPETTASVKAAGDQAGTVRSAAEELQRAADRLPALIAVLEGGGGAGSADENGGAGESEETSDPEKLLSTLETLLPTLRERAETLAGQIKDFRERKDLAVARLAASRQALQGGDADAMARREQAVQRLELTDTEAALAEVRGFLTSPAADLSRLKAGLQEGSGVAGPGSIERHETCVTLRDPTRRSGLLTPLVTSWQEVQTAAGELTQAVEKRQAAIDGVEKRLSLLREEAKRKRGEAEAGKARTRDPDEKATIAGQIKKIDGILAKADTKETEGIVPERDAMSAARADLRTAAEALRSGIEALRRLAGE